ncbi:MAG: ergothioneine biosynthesis protein EgtB [Fuerstiella sp.]
MTSVSPNALSNDTHARQQNLLAKYQALRSFTDRIVAPLEPEDCVIQSMPDVSPARWHLAHTTWFFETFVLKPLPGFRACDERFEYLFNSYYNAVGEQFPRAQRGLLSRPTVAEILDYRRRIDEQVAARLDSEQTLTEHELDVVELGLNHEQQHQELMLTDIKHVLSCNPLMPRYESAELQVGRAAEAARWIEFDEGLYEIGHTGNDFAFDNESPRHRVFLDSFALRDQTVTVGEYLEFIGDGGYQRPELWLSLGWNQVHTHGWKAPLYWVQQDGVWTEFTLGGQVELQPSLPVCHVSYFEADAFARWAGVRLATEAEWEVASEGTCAEGNFATSLMESGAAIHPGGGPVNPSGLQHVFGNVWEWTSSSYAAYPGYQPPDGALGEYNGKFMCNQYVLRGGSCATPGGHVRRTYRNFFPPESRWQFSGIRLARALEGP